MYIELGRPDEHCGIVGVYGVEDAARDVYFSLFALQHRGQESAGISSAYGKYIFTHAGMGLIPAVFDEEDITKLVGDMAIGHTRYSTYGGSKKEYCQPVSLDKNLVLAHNGNLPITKPLEDFLDSKGIEWNNCNDTMLMYKAINYNLKRGAELSDAVEQIYHLVDGVYACVAMTSREFVAFQDRCAMKPLCMGRVGKSGYVFASETCALDTIGAKFMEEVKPGEMFVLKDNKMRRKQAVTGDLKRDSWEFVYFARPDSVMLGRSIEIVRLTLGKLLAQKYPTDADIVIGVPNSGTTASIGYAQESGIPWQEGLIKNNYIGRTFIQPNKRAELVRLKLNPIEEIITGKRVVLVDDSIVRGTTTPKVISILRNKGAREIHMRIPAPPYKWPDYYGTDTPIQEGLIAAKKSEEEICKFIGADSLRYLSFEATIQAIGLPESQLSTSWFTGVYPISIGELANNIRDLKTK